MKRSRMETLHLAEPGLTVGKKSERLVVRRSGEVLSEHALMNLEQVILSGRGVGLSSDVIMECCGRGIPITLLTPAGRTYGQIQGDHAAATVLIRRAQLSAVTGAAGVRAALGMASGKLQNQATLLLYFSKYRRKKDTVLHGLLRDAAAQIRELAQRLGELSGETTAVIRPTLLNLEGRAGACYWGAVARLLEGQAEFPGRRHRGAGDPVNAALNYGYGILQGHVWNAVHLAGLDPYGGFIHVDRPGRPALVLDLMEEFRQPAVDRSILAALGQGWSPEIEGDEEDAGSLTREARGEIARRVLARLAAPVRYRGQRHALKNVIQLQARRVAVCVRTEEPYAAFTSGW